MYQFTRHVCRLLIVVCLVTAITLPVAKSQAAGAPKPDAALATILIRDALAALNQANWTGNYTVLRDYASPSFAKANDPVRLTSIFQPIRAQGLDLAPVLVLAPIISIAELDKNGKRLKLVGHFASKPKQVHFELIFESIVSRWRLFGISVWAKQVQDKNLQISMNQQQHLQVQQLLNGLGYEVGTPDGIFGEKTINGIKRFQIDNKFQPSGTLTIEQFNRLFEKKLQTAKKQ